MPRLQRKKTIYLPSGKMVVDDGKRSVSKPRYRVLTRESAQELMCALKLAPNLKRAQKLIDPLCEGRGRLGVIKYDAFSGWIKRTVMNEAKIKVRDQLAEAKRLHSVLANL